MARLRGGPAWDRAAAATRRRRIRTWLTVALFLLLVVGALSLWWLSYRVPFSQRSEVKVTGFVVAYVSDGDTVVVADASGIEHSVRLIGVNTPEVTHGAVAGECFGDAARDTARALLPRGSTVVLLRDPALPAADQYGRELAYVEVGGLDVGRTLLERGAAVVYELRSQAVPSRSATYRAAERQASVSKAGLWGACPAPPSRRS